MRAATAYARFSVPRPSCWPTASPAQPSLQVQLDAFEVVFGLSHTCLLVSYRPLAHAGFLTREPWKPRPGDGISSNWLIAELTHRQALASSSVLT